MNVSSVTQVQSIPRQTEIQPSLCEFYHAIWLFCLGDEPAWDGEIHWWWSYFLGGFVRYMRRAQSYRHSSKNLTWSIFSEILPVRFKLTNSNNRNGIFTKNPSCFWNHTHTNVLSIQLILTPGFSYLQTVTQETNLLVLKRSVSEVWMKRSGEWQIHVHLAVFFLRHGTSFWWFYLLDDPFLAQSFLFDPLFVEAFDL